MKYDFDDMVEGLKKEISDNLTRRISFAPIEPAKGNHFKIKKESDKKKLIILILLMIISFVLLAGSIIFYKLDTKVKEQYKFNNDIKTEVISNDSDFSSKNEVESLYLQDLISKIKINFSTKPLMDGEYSYYKNVIAKIEILDANDENTTVFQTSEYLVKGLGGNADGNKEDVTNVLVDFQKYNNSIVKYNNKISITTKAKLTIEYTNKITTKTGLVKTIKESVEMPLGENMVYLTTDYNKTDLAKIVEKSKYTAIIIIVFIISLLSFISSFIYTILIIRSNKDSLSELEKKYKKIMNNYNNIIIEVENDFFDKKLITVDVKYFVDIIDAQQELHVPILCYTDKVTARTWFYIVTDKLIYKYELNKTNEPI